MSHRGLTEAEHGKVLREELRPWQHDGFDDLNESLKKWKVNLLYPNFNTVSGIGILRPKGKIQTYMKGKYGTVAFYAKLAAPAIGQLEWLGMEIGDIIDGAMGEAGAAFVVDGVTFNVRVGSQGTVPNIVIPWDASYATEFTRFRIQWNPYSCVFTIINTTVGTRTYVINVSPVFPMYVFAEDVSTDLTSQIQIVHCQWMLYDFEHSYSPEELLVRLSSDKDNHFTGAIAQDAKEDEDIIGLKSNHIRITRVAIQADENLRFRFLLWKTDGKDDADLDVDSFLAAIDLDIPSEGLRIAGANQYYLSKDVNIPYCDEDDTFELHCSLQCVSLAGKTAGAAGEVKIDTYYESLE